MSKINKPFTPMFDDITQNIGPLASAIFGVVWRYCQMKEETCWASLGTIAQRSGTSAPTVAKYLEVLVDADYLVDTTPGAKGSSHRYLLGANADRYIKIELDVQPPQEWVDEVDDLSKSLEVPIKKLRGTDKNFDTKIVTKREVKITEPAKKSTNGQYNMMSSIGDVCQMDVKLNNGQIGRVAKGLLKAGYTPAQISQFYSGESCWWYQHDWRGKLKNPPKPAQINETIKQAVLSNVDNETVKLRF